MTDEQIKHMTNRFLQWILPKDFSPDAGISFTRPNSPESWPGPSGTNLLNADQAERMIRHIVEGLPFDDSAVESWLSDPNIQHVISTDLDAKGRACVLRGAFVSGQKAAVHD